MTHEDYQNWAGILMIYDGEQHPCYSCGTFVEVGQWNLCLGCHRVICDECYRNTPHDPHNGTCRFILRDITS